MKQFHVQLFARRIRRLAVAVFLFAGAALGAAEWSENYDEALAQAKSSKRPMLLLFTGSDWCPPCMQLEKKVFSSQPFAAFGEREVVLMKADFPRGEQDPVIARQNAALQRQFPIQGYPTVLLLDPDSGKVIFANSGYGGQTPDQYVAMLREAIGKAAPPASAA